MSPIQPNKYAIFADYFRYGIESGVVQSDLAKDWAFEIIEIENQPPIEIINVAMAANKPAVYDALGSVKGGRNPEVSGSWLFSRLLQILKANSEPLDWLVTRSLQVARSTFPDENIGFEFDHIEDCLNLAKAGIYGTTEQSRLELTESLKKYAKPYGAGT